MTFRPDVTVAAVVERDSRFLLVEERAGRRIVFNQPAGHLEDGESLLDAVMRETLEETTCRFTPQWLLGIYLWRNPSNDRTFLRVAFSGTVGEPEPARTLDRSIIRTTWMSRGQLADRPNMLRSPLVLRCIADYEHGTRHPLTVLQTLDLGTLADIAHPR
jgi:8-oxo-dGTP pyrophosphatase MutT (NUDIX family)